MSFLDKAKEKATQLTAQAKEKVDDVKDQHKADGLLEELGRIVYRQRIAGIDRDGDTTRVDEILAQLKALEAEGATVQDKDPAAVAPAPAADAAEDDAPPPPPPPPPPAPAV
jgi:hypothetical protein